MKIRKIETLPTQTPKEMHDMVCEHMGKLAFIWVNTGKRLLVKLDPKHKEHVTIGWIIKVELSELQHEDVCNCKKPGKVILRDGSRTCETCKKLILI